MSASHENLKPIRFAGELLPNWAQLLDLAALFIERTAEGFTERATPRFEAIAAKR